LSNGARYFDQMAPCPGVPFLHRSALVAKVGAPDQESAYCRAPTAGKEYGQILHEEMWQRRSGAKLKAIRGNFWKTMGRHIEQSSAPAADTPEPIVSKSVEEGDPTAYM
jgi:hypothetical protein